MEDSSNSATGSDNMHGEWGYKKDYIETKNK
jgi:hypothetical protein